MPLKSLLHPKSSECERLALLLRRERSLRRRGFRLIAGVDEAGRGPMAGPVVAAACVLHRHRPLLAMNDSKKLTREQRAYLYSKLTSSSTVQYGIGIVDHTDIDRLNIYHATLYAMQLALENLPHTPDYILVDGNVVPDLPLPSESIVRGDALCYSIAAASILAKEVRDRLMEQYHEQWPQYGFAQHKGYCTASHRRAVEEHGLSPIHRRTFRFLKEA